MAIVLSVVELGREEDVTVRALDLLDSSVVFVHLALLQIRAGAQLVQFMQHAR